MGDFNELKKRVDEISNLPTNNVDNEKTFDNLKSQYFKAQVEQGKSISEIATDFAKAKTTTEIINNEGGKYDKLHKEFAEEQKETLLQGYRQDKLEGQANTLKKEREKAEAFYMSVRPILEFDFDNLTKKNKETQPKKYEDRSYGIPLMVIMLILLTIPYCIVSIILALLNGINAVCEAISTFSVIARRIIWSAFFVFIVALAVYCILLGIDALFGTSIIQYLKL